MGGRRWGRLIVAFAMAVATFAAGTIAAGGAPPPVGFTDNVVLSGLELPTNVAFAPDGRIFVAEKSGIVRVFDNLNDPTPSLFADLRTQVYNYGDLGLVGLAVHPNPATPFVYLTYTYDAPIGGTAPTYGQAGATFDDCTVPVPRGCPSSGRLSRLPASGATAGPEQVLITDWCQGGGAGHSMDEVRFGPDGALYVTGGDGARAGTMDIGGSPYANTCADPPSPTAAALTAPTSEGGALRAQDLRTPGDPQTLDGTMIRVDPNTGAALPNNPNASSPDPNARRVVAYGLRNAFRFTFRPGTSEIWITDVGWRTREELNRIVSPTDASVENFGWPCYEGSSFEAGYDSLNVNLCESLYTQGANARVNPYYHYGHTQQIVSGGDCAPGDQGSIGTPLFYPGGSYPDRYDNALFFSDYARQCLFVMLPGADGLPSTANIEEFSTQVGGIVDLELGPGGDIYYLDVLAGTVHRISFTTATNRPPVADARANPTAGAVPLAVQFDATQSSDPDGDALTYAWDLDGDGQFDDSTSPTPTRTYTTAATVTVGLRVTDARNASATDTVLINAGNTPPTPTIANPAATLTWRVGDQIAFSGSAADAQDGTLPASALSWQIVINHCPSVDDCHVHPLTGATGVASGSFFAPDHEYFAYLELTLTATDNNGASASVTRRVDPQTVSASVQSSPPGIALGLNDESVAAPFSRSLIRGSSNTISAPPTAQLNGTTYTFTSWSDGGAASHSFVADATSTRTATYTPQSTGTAALLVVGNPTTPSASDLAVRSRLVALGLTVTTADDNGITAAAANGKQLIVISSTVVSSAIQQTFAATSIPVAIWDRPLYDDFGMTANPPANGDANGTTLRIVTGGVTHPIAAGLPRDVVVTTTPQTIPWGTPTSGATIVAAIPGNPTFGTAFAYETGATMVGRTAPARRVGLFLGDTAATAFTTNGGRLFDNAIRWALGQP